MLGAYRMEESMEEEEGGSYEAMMDDQNHNNWEAAVEGFRQPPPPPPSIPAPARETPGGQLLAMPAVSVDRKGPKEGLPMGPPPPPPEANGVIMMLKSGDAASVAKAAPAPTPGSTININTSTSKFCESSLSPEALAFPPPHADAESVPLGQPFFLCFRPGSPLPQLLASFSPSLPGLVSVGRRRAALASCITWPIKEQSGLNARSPEFSCRRDPYHDWLALNVRKLFSSPFPLKFHPQT